MGRHCIRQKRSPARTTLTAAAIAVAATSFAIASAGTANAKTHHGPGAPGNPFTFTTGSLSSPQAGVVESSTTSIVRHSTSSTPEENTTNSGEVSTFSMTGPSNQLVSLGPRTENRSGSFDATLGTGTPTGESTTETPGFGALGAPSGTGQTASSSGPIGGLLGQSSLTKHKH